MLKECFVFSCLFLSLLQSADNQRLVHNPYAPLCEYCLCKHKKNAKNDIIMPNQSSDIAMQNPVDAQRANNQNHMNPMPVNDGVRKFRKIYDEERPVLQNCYNGRIGYVRNGNFHAMLPIVISPITLDQNGRQAKFRKTYYKGRPVFKNRYGNIGNFVDGKFKPF